MSPDPQLPADRGPQPGLLGKLSHRISPRSHVIHQNTQDAPVRNMRPLPSVSMVAGGVSRMRKARRPGGPGRRVRDVVGQPAVQTRAAAGPAPVPWKPNSVLPPAGTCRL